jgi:hypothetical protein
MLPLCKASSSRVNWGVLLMPTLKIARLEESAAAAKGTLGHYSPATYSPATTLSTGSYSATKSLSRIS